VQDLSLACDPGSTGFDCPRGENPEATDSSLICSDPSPQTNGTDGYCCATLSGTTTCTQDTSIQDCAYPSVGFSCSGTDTPEQADTSLTCSTGTPDPSSGLTLYCCQ
jgi:hypothetical protein